MLSKIKSSRGFTFSKKMQSAKGFTLIEVVVVIALLAILAGIVLVAINPAQNSQDARNTKRQSDVLQILNAVNQYYVSNGYYPANMPAIADGLKDIKSGAALGDICDGGTKKLVPTFIAELPFDPSAIGAHFTDCSDYNTGFKIQLTAGNRVTVTAPSAEGTTISVTR